MKNWWILARDKNTWQRISSKPRVDLSRNTAAHDDDDDDDTTTTTTTTNTTANNNNNKIKFKKLNLWLTAPKGATPVN